MNFISSAYAQTGAQQPPPGGDFIPLLMMVAMFVFFYFIAIRPQRKRQKEHQELVNNLAKGDEVITSSGILGKVNKLDDHYVVLQVADSVELKFQKVAVHAVLPKGTIKAI